MKIIEITASNGMLEIYREFLVVGKENQAEYLYIIKENQNVIETISTTFTKFWQIVLTKYPHIYNYDLQYIEEKLKKDLIIEIRKKIISKEFTLNDTWPEKLTDIKQILEEIDYFDFDQFVEKINNFKNRLDIEHWNYIEVNHSNFENKEQFRKYILSQEIFPIKISGLYSFFKNHKCIYIGKAKNIRDRIESHYLSSHNLGNLTRGEKQRKLFGKYLKDDLIIYYTELNDEYDSQIGEELRLTIERQLHLKYKPEFIDIE
jgi:hypothetical protein